MNSEVGRLRRVLVCRPGLAQRRLTPANCRELLFDDVLWVSQARNDHDAFTNAMVSRDVEVLELHDLLATTVADPAARTWLLDRKLGPGTVDTELAQQLRPWLEALPPLRLAEHLIGGLARAELPFEPEGLLARYAAATDFLLPPAAQHAVQPRQQLLDRRRRGAVPDVLARAPTGDAADRRGLPVPSAVRRPGDDLVGRSGPGTTAAPRWKAAT